MELLLVSHRGIACGMKSAVQMVLGPAAEQITAMELTEEEGIEAFGKRLEAYLLEWLTEGKKGLIFADLRGGTPFNQSELLLAKHGLKTQAKVISGMNFPMIVDALFRDIDVCDMEAIREIMMAAQNGITCMDAETSADSGDDE